MVLQTLVFLPVTGEGMQLVVMTTQNHFNTFGPVHVYTFVVDFLFQFHHKQWNVCPIEQINLYKLINRNSLSSSLQEHGVPYLTYPNTCLLYTSDAADE